MKKLLLTLLMVSPFLFSSSSFAQSKDETAVANAVQKLRKAMIDADKTALENIVADELSYGHSDNKIEDKTAFVRALSSNESDFETMDLTDQTIRIVGKNAIVRHKLSAITKNNGKPGTAKLSVLLVWQKQKGGWKLLARQAVKI